MAIGHFSGLTDGRNVHSGNIKKMMPIKIIFYTYLGRYNILYLPIFHIREDLYQSYKEDKGISFPSLLYYSLSVILERRQRYSVLLKTSRTYEKNLYVSPMIDAIIAKIYPCSKTTSLANHKNILLGYSVYPRSIIK